MGNLFSGGQAPDIQNVVQETIKREGELYVRHRMKQVVVSAIDSSSWGTLTFVIPLMFSVLLFVVAMFFILGMLCYENVKAMFWRTLWAFGGSVAVFTLGYGFIFAYVWFYELQ
ncbi:MAG: hypothetical protein AB7P49_00055 [Bdellovibrionales bacterium]